MTRGHYIGVLVLGAMLAVASTSLAQTTGSISGLVTAKADGSVLPGAQTTAVHEPTGTRYTTISSGDGRFRMLNVRVGGLTLSPSPWTVSTRRTRPAFLSSSARMPV